MARFARFSPCRISRALMALAIGLAFLGLALNIQRRAHCPRSETGLEHPVSSLAIVPLTIDSAGSTRRFQVEVACTAAQQSRGLMFRGALGSDEGMIFPFPRPQSASFWMKNTPQSLDILFIGADHRILNIAADTTPYSLDSITSDGKAIAVLELPAGRAQALGIAAGDRVEY
ncbi:DUF192 domain-containing protein [Erythrobacter sp. MTPC3]|uniref:DUF192 domain-containing protein n=1 Tax=Erythrobacter sp. MTPC3 TaxID=3056564 RepID=UPI0036F40DB6